MKRLIIASMCLAFGCEGGVSIDNNTTGGPDDDGKVVGGNGTIDDPTIRDDGTVIVDGAEIDPSRVTIHRLNRAEYNNTVRDLLGDTTQPATDFPDDDFGYGFNNIADVLTVSQRHLELYNQTATRLIDAALSGGAIAELSQRFEAETVGSPVGTASGEEWNLFSNGTITTTYNFPADGEYRIVVRARQTAAGPDNALMGVYIDNQSVENFDVAATNLANFETMTTVTAGTHSVSVDFQNDFFMDGMDRNLLVDYFEVVGPIGATGEISEERARIMICEPSGQTEFESCGRNILTTFAKRAWRRPPEDTEIDDLMTLVDLGISEENDFEVGIRLALRAILVSPNFIFRIEFDDDIEDATPHMLNDYELAARLSYFLWSSMPDEELTALADAGQLNDIEVLRAQVDRMMNDEKSVALVNNLATQWLHIDSVREAMPDYETFPEWNDEFKEEMRTETRMFIQEIFDANLSIRDLLLARYTWVNQDLAQHYGLPYTDSEFHRVDIPDERRRGFLSQGGFLTVTSRATRTAPSLRGDWILKNILCEKPDDMPEIEVEIDENPPEGLSLREQLEEHSNSEGSCYSCHYEMDRFGLALENFDGIGQWRDMDNGAPIDATSEIAGFGEFNGAFELSEMLVEDERYNDCLTKKFVTYAIGRGTETYDQPQIDLIVENAAEQNLNIRDLFKEIVVSPAFRMRRGGELPAVEE